MRQTDVQMDLQHAPEEVFSTLVDVPRWYRWHWDWPWKDGQVTTEDSVGLGTVYRAPMTVKVRTQGSTWEDLTVGVINLVDAASDRPTVMRPIETPSAYREDSYLLHVAKISAYEPPHQVSFQLLATDEPQSETYLLEHRGAGTWLQCVATRERDPMAGVLSRLSFSLPGQRRRTVQTGLQRLRDLLR